MSESLVELMEPHEYFDVEAFADALAGTVKVYLSFPTLNLNMHFRVGDTIVFGTLGSWSEIEDAMLKRGKAEFSVVGQGKVFMQKFVVENCIMHRDIRSFLTKPREIFPTSDPEEIWRLSGVSREAFFSAPVLEYHIRPP